MYAALFEMSSWLGPEQHIVRGGSAADLLSGFEEVQSLSCLVRMGRGREDAEGQKMLIYLEDILFKRDSGTLTNEDLLAFDIKISLGTIKCVEIIEGDSALEQLKEKHPQARVIY
jgi:hypothetical protein